MNEGKRPLSVQTILTQECLTLLSLRIGITVPLDENLQHAVSNMSHFVEGLSLDALHSLNVTIGTALWNDLGMRG